MKQGIEYAKKFLQDRKEPVALSDLTILKNMQNRIKQEEQTLKAWDKSER